MILSPFESEETVDVNKEYCNRDEVLEQGFHPLAHFKTFAGVGFDDKVVPAPTPFVTAEQCDDKATERKKIC